MRNSNESENRRTGIRLVLLCAMFAWGGPGEAAPAYIPIKTRVLESDVIVVAEIRRAKERSRGKTRAYLNLPLRVREVLKGKAPGRFMLPLLIEPRGYGKYLRSPPPPGVYILFLKRSGKKNKKTNARNGKTLLVPYEPQNFFFLAYSNANMRRVTLHLLK